MQIGEETNDELNILLPYLKNMTYRGDLNFDQSKYFLSFVNQFSSLVKRSINQQIDRSIDRSTDWPAHLPTDQLTDWTDWSIDRLTDQPTDQPTDQLTDWPINRRTDRPSFEQPTRIYDPHWTFHVGRSPATYRTICNLRRIAHQTKMRGIGHVDCVQQAYIRQQGVR